MAYPLAITDWQANVNDGGTWVKDVSGATPSQESGREASNAGADDPAKLWEPADLDPANTRVIRRFSRRRPVRVLNERSNSAASASSARRLILPKRPGGLAERYVLRDDPNGQCVSPNFTGSADCTVEFVYRWRHKATSAQFPAYKGSAFSVPGRDWGLVINSAGKIGFQIVRYTSLSQVVTPSAQVDGRFHSILLVLDDTARTGDLYLDGVWQAQVTSVSAFVSNSDTFNIFTPDTNSALDIAKAAIWSRKLSTDEITEKWDSRVEANDPSLELLYRFDDGSGNVTDHSGNSRTGTVTACSWVKLPNTSARCKDTGPLSPGGPWETRRALRANGGSGTAATATSATLTPYVCLAGWISVDAEHKPAADVQALLWGASWAARDFGLLVTDAGELELDVLRVSGSQQTVTSAAVNDGVPRFVRIVLDGYGTTAYLYVDEVSQGSTSISAYVAATNAKLELSAGFLGHFLGDLVIWTAEPTAAEISAARDGRLVPEGDEDSAHVWRLGDEVSSSTITDHGGGTFGAGAKDLTVTSMSFETVASPRDLARRSTPLRDRWSYDLGEVVETDEILWILFDPENADGALYVRRLGAWESLEAVIAPREGASGFDGNDPRPIDSGWPVFSLHPPRGNGRVTLQHLKRAEAERVQTRIRSRAMVGVPVLDGYDPAHHDMEWRFGLIVGSGPVRDRRILQTYPGSVELEVYELP